MQAPYHILKYLKDIAQAYKLVNAFFLDKCIFIRTQSKNMCKGVVFIAESQKYSKGEDN